MLDHKYLVFHKVTQNKSFTKAAEELYITQSAVTKSIKALEVIKGGPLLNRSGNSISLTDLGKVLLVYIEYVMKLEKSLSLDMNLLKAKMSGKLRIGASTTVAQYSLPKALAQFQKKFNDLELSLVVKNSRRIEDMVISGEVDLGIVEGISQQKGLTYSPYLKDELVIVASIRNPIAEQPFSIEEFIKTPLVVREWGSGTLEVISKKLQDHRISLNDLNIQLNIGSTEGIKSYLDHSDCIGILSIQSIAKDLLYNRFKILEIENIQFFREFSFVLPQGVTSGLPLLFTDFVKQQDSF